TSNGRSIARIAKGSRSIKLLEQDFASLKTLMQLFHPPEALKVRKTVALECHSIVIEKRLDEKNRMSKRLDKGLKCGNCMRERSLSTTHLTGCKTGFHCRFLRFKVAHIYPEIRTPSIGHPVHIESVRIGIIHNV
ncbi:MAG: hypothetical protein GTN64_04720, partial [Candidatus Latescibacteria bacterium]|nr:hypothetical protein [Candidatus Latescibacterota bacterium]NIO77911.1 hypothetical protein [Candidatus Latescibacterota bacterium]